MVPAKQHKVGSQGGRTVEVSRRVKKQPLRTDTTTLTLPTIAATGTESFTLPTSTGTLSAFTHTATVTKSTSIRTLAALMQTIITTTAKTAIAGSCKGPDYGEMRDSMGCGTSCYRRLATTVLQPSHLYEGDPTQQERPITFSTTATSATTNTSTSASNRTTNNSNNNNIVNT